LKSNFKEWHLTFPKHCIASIEEFEQFNKDNWDIQGSNYVIWHAMFKALMCDENKPSIFTASYDEEREDHKEAYGHIFHVSNPFGDTKLKYEENKDLVSHHQETNNYVRHAIFLF
jgi:hypothetical protein